ncbi:MAG: flagellar protein FlbD [Chloroflexi bacterium]|nr:MAG: flagellar protein FlbD [Chloroflexota bacterium]
MIKVTRLDQSQLYLNAEFIQSVESTPDTHIVLVNGHSYVVRESDDEVVSRIVHYRRLVHGADAGAGRGALHLVSNE